MCLSIPSKVIAISDDNIATTDTMGIQREVSLDLMGDEIEVGDYILIHVGFAMNKIDKAEALASLEVYKEMVEAMEEEDRKRIVQEAENCPNTTP